MRTITFDESVYKLVPVDPTDKMTCVLKFGRTQPVHNTYLNLLKAVPADLPGVVAHSGEPITKNDIETAWRSGYYHAGYTNDSAYADQEAEKFSAEYESPAQTDTAMFNAMLTEASRIDGAMPDTEALQARIAELESLNTQLRNLAYERTGMTFTAINDGVFIDGFGLLPVGSIEKWESLLAALESQLAAQAGQEAPTNDVVLGLWKKCGHAYDDAHAIMFAEALLARAQDTTPFDVIFFDISKERAAQDSQWGGASHDNSHSAYDFARYIGRQLKRLNDAGFPERYTLIKIAALSVAAIETMDRKGGSNA